MELNRFFFLILRTRLQLVRQYYFNTLRTGEADLRFYITIVQDG